jgi:radical SAM superfamily enzyme YgiQ (UPF0313 family)
MGMKRILLVAPLQLRFELTQDHALMALPFSKVKSFLTPLHLATIAAATPDEYQVDIWDESVQGPVEERANWPDYHATGVTGFTAHLPRAKAIAQFFRKRGTLVAAGGPGISSVLHWYLNDFDVVFIGEAELTWPKFLAELKVGRPQKTYRQLGPVSLAQSPSPRWESIAGQMERYLLGGVQTSRGCPFDCEFCDVSALFGQRFRHKPVDNVLQEVAALEKVGVQRILFCDDNFYGNPSYAKDLLRELIPLNNSFRYPLAFATEATINLASDEEFLELAADCNFREFLVGIESPRKESLKETKKISNLRGDIVSDVRKIQSYGISVRGSLIVGFDNDDKDIFEEQFQFIKESALTVPSIRVLMAPEGTRLWDRLRKEGRLVRTKTEGRSYGNPGTTNIIPKQMTRGELHGGYLNLCDRVYDWENFAVRLRDFLVNTRRAPKVPRQKKYWDRWLQIGVLLFTDVDKRTRRIILSIVRLTLTRAPFMMPRVAAIILRQYGYTHRPKLREAIQRQIALEQSGEITLEAETGDVSLSEGFKKEYGRIFEELYRKVYEGLTEKAQVEDVLIEVFSGYLKDCKPGWIPRAGDYRSGLLEFARVMVAEKNRGAKLEGVWTPWGDEVISKIRKAGVADRILRAVEQEMRIAEARRESVVAS